MSTSAKGGVPCVSTCQLGYPQCQSFFSRIFRQSQANKYLNLCRRKNGRKDSRQVQPGENAGKRIILA